MVEKAKSAGKPDKERTYVIGLGFCGNGVDGNLSEVDVKNGKIVRIRPLRYDRKYKPEEFKPWKIEARGKVYEPPMKTLPPPLALAYKKRVYSSNRILHPLKRVDFDPNGERNIENRGKSGYVRISWDEALDIVVGEIKRIIDKYGPYAIFSQSDGHGETKIVQGGHGAHRELLDLLGGYTQQTRNPDSWEGWYWGAKHVWGCEPVGMSPQSNLMLDVAENTDILLHWGCDAETTSWGWAGQSASRFLYWFTELGVKHIFICPDINHSAAVHADKWIPILPNTDAAMQLAIAYIWITEDTYDKEYIKTHTIGFDKLKDYVLGKEDGIPKTPKWASELCGVPSRIIKALAREWASKSVSIVHGNGGSYIRGPYSTEPARLEVALLAMQALGKPGRNQVKMMEWGFFGRPEEMPVPRPVVMPQVFACYKGFDVTKYPKQIIPKDLVHEAILNAPISWYGTTLLAEKTENQFKKYTYPVEGYPEVHMIWTDSPCWITCWNGGNKCIDAFQSPKIEFIVAQHIWLENDCLFADVILPVRTKFEELDIGVDGLSGQYRTIQYEGQCIEPLGESKGDWEIAQMVAERLGLLDKITQGKSTEEWMKIGFDHSGCAGLISWGKFKENEYFVVPTDPNWYKNPRGLQEFYEDPEKHPLTTPTGKLEIYSEKLAKYFPDDEERPPYPKWIPYGKTHQESLLCERAKKYPILVCSNHPRWGVHANHDDITWFREIKTCKVKGPDGYLYHTIWINPKDAADRGIEDGDVVKIYNERGGVLAGAYVTERIMSGVISIDHGAKYDPIVPGELDRGGAINTITPGKTTSPNATGMATSGFLVEIERVNLDELRKKYPEAFSRPFHPAAGPGTESFILGGKKKMGKVLIIDISKCNGCYNCQIACKDEHVGNDWTPYAKPQPDTGQFWMKVTDLVRGTVPKVKVAYMHDICQHCDDAPCIPACKQNAIYKRDDGIVIIDPEKCVGSRGCVDACPYGVIYFNGDLNISQKCTMCAHLLDKGWKEPRCVDACPTDALRFGEESELKEYISKAEPLRPDLDVKPRVYYIGIPKRFVAGAVYDPEEDECTEGATATLTRPDTGEKLTVQTDSFGDFWFEGLEVGTYSLAIDKDGYYPQKFKSISTEKDVNLGDIKLYKQA